MANIKIAGRIGVDPESRYTSSGQQVITLNLQLYTGKDKAGNYNPSRWARVTVWDISETAKSLKKGDHVTVEGWTQPVKVFTRKDGTYGESFDISATRLVLGDEFKPVQQEQWDVPF